MIEPTLKKRCPRCKSGKFNRIWRKGWMRLLPGTRYYQCRRCKCRFLVLFGADKPIENRVFSRFRLKNGLNAYRSSDGSELGQVVDISRGGMAFDYIADMDVPKGGFFIDLRSGRESPALRRLPVHAVSDMDTGRMAPFSNIPIRRCGVKFNQIPVSRKTQLQMLIRKYRYNGNDKDSADS
jgi:hypothetical protein